MSLSRWTLVVMTGFLMISGTSAKEAPAPDPLFQGTDIIDVRIVAPLSTILVERPFEEELPATFQYTNSAGEAVTLDIKMRTRGKFRRQKEVCDFPPMRLNFVTSQTKNTLFDKQDKVKLVTHCQATPRYEQTILREYIAYRILNVMTDASFGVRLLRINYIDAEGKKRDDVRYGFIIEDEDRLAKRLEKSALDIPETRVSALDPEYGNLVSVFHYLIGNTDFSTIQAMEGHSCCHNHVLFGNEGQPIWSVPYDFDQSGLVNAPHAGPNPRFKLRNVRARLYRGRCVNNNRLDATIASYNSKQDEILQVINEVEASSSQTLKFLTSYVEAFYRVLNSESLVNREIVKKCI